MSVKEFEKRCLYVVTDPQAQKGRSHLQVLTEAIQGGARVVQLRDKLASDEVLAALGKKVREVCNRWGALLIINERVAVARAVDADGLHIGQEDFSISEARKRMGPGRLLGVSTHNLVQAKKAQAEGADYIGVGPIFSTPTKPDYRPVGVELIQQVRESVTIPFVAIGGINLTNVEEVLAAGAYSIAVVRAVVAQEDVLGAAKKFKAVLDAWKEKNNE